jgi:transaldolase
MLNFEYEKEEIINQEMQCRRHEVLKKISKIVHSSYAEEFAKVLHYSWQEGLPEAEKIAEDLDFYPIDFVAIAQNEKEFKDLFIKETEYLMEEYG